MADKMSPTRSRQVLTMLWLLINLFMFALLLSAFITAEKNSVPLRVCYATTTAAPSVSPSVYTASPTAMPTPLASSSPSLPNNGNVTITSTPTSTSKAPSSKSPTRLPTKSPTANPTAMPTLQPTLAPTTIPPVSQNATNTTTTTTTNDTTGGDDLFYDDGNASFVLVWAVILMVCLCLFGSSVLKRHREPFYIGMFIGVVAVMCNVMLIIAVATEGEARRKVAAGVDDPAAYAVVTFSTIEFLLLFVFGVILFNHQEDIYETSDAAKVPPEFSLEPGQDMTTI